MKKPGVVGSIVLLLGVAGLVLNLPDIIRYLRMKMM